MNRLEISDFVFPDNAIVVRGGTSSPPIILRSCYQVGNAEYGLAVVCGAGRSLEDLCEHVLHDTVRWTTVAVIRRAGGDVIKSPGRSPDSSSLIGLRTFPGAGDNPMDKRADKPLDEFGPRHGPENGMSDLPSVFADFHNADRLGRCGNFNTRGAREDFTKLGIQPFLGLTIRLYDGEQFSVEGRVIWDDTEGWVAEIDWSKL